LDFHNEPIRAALDIQFPTGRNCKHPVSPSIRQMTNMEKISQNISVFNDTKTINLDNPPMKKTPKIAGMAT
jgi:hypothetical protein